MTPVEIGSREWQELVSDTRTAASTSAWVVGDNALRVPHGHLEEFAEAAEVNYGTLRNYRYVASRWPEDARVDGASFKVHAVLASREDRFELCHPGMTKKEALEAIGNSTTDRRGQQAATVLSVVNEIIEIKRRVRAAFRVTVSMNPTDNDRQLILSDLADVESETEEFRLYLLGESLDDTIARIMEEV